MEIAGAHVPRHGIRIAVIWAILTAVSVPLIVLVLGPHIPPGRMSAESGAQKDANILLMAILTPIMLLIWVFFAYSLIVFRQRGDVIEDGPPLKGFAPAQILWIVVTTVIVLGLAVWGSYTLLVSSHGSGGGQGPDPVSLPKGHEHALPIQVIGQQWDWTFRYPTYGGFESRDVVLPDHVLVAFHVTSLDVTHSFWAYQLGVKADAVPGVDNIAYVNPRQIGTFQIRCAELCGLWHGHMAKKGRVVSNGDFQTWVAQELKNEAPSLKVLPPFDRFYYPDPLRRAG
jgi:cytochrome c oxidase subunit 2